jgi:pimeloyl-ACP methyl ester carboxylesterase
VRLHDSYQGPKELQVLEGAGHNEVSGQTPAWWREVFEFWQKNAG